MRIDLQNASQKDTSFAPVELGTLAQYADTVHGLLESGGYSSPESALFAPSDHATRNQVKEFVTPLLQGLRTVFLVGIGGSDLGTRAVYEALRTTELRAGDVPRLHVLSTIDPAALREARELIDRANDPSEVVLVIVSKSGTTMETLANANILYHALQAHFGSAACTRTIVISDSEAPIASEARLSGLRHFPIPAAIGGRYSVFTAVGLIPLALLGVNIDELCDGGRAAVLASFIPGKSTPTSELALHLFGQYRNGYSIHEFFVWHPELEMLGKWYRQLLSESVGKCDPSGAPVGITPTVAIGSTDLHSLGQLVFGGPRIRFTTFVASPSRWDDTDRLLDDTPFSHTSLRGKRVGDVIRAIYGGVTTSYRSDQLPFASVTLEAISPRELGACMAFHMGMVMYLAKLLTVSAFDQPDVERYKEETRRILAAQ